MHQCLARVHQRVQESKDEQWDESAQQHDPLAALPTPCRTHDHCEPDAEEEGEYREEALMREEVAQCPRDGVLR